MTNQELKQKARELGEQQTVSGLTKREYFAGLALEKVSMRGMSPKTKYKDLAKAATEMADALLYELVREKMALSTDEFYVYVQSLKGVLKRFDDKLDQIAKNQKIIFGKLEEKEQPRQEKQ